MPNFTDRSFRASILILIAFPFLIALACNLPRVQREESSTNPFTGEEVIDEYTLSDEELIDEYLDEALEQLAIGDGCDSFALRHEMEQALNTCKALASGPDDDISVCMQEQMAEYWESFESTCTTPTISPLDDGEALESAGSLALVSHQAVMDTCTQEQQGHAFRVACDFTVHVNVEYTAASLPASLFCEARRTFILAQADAVLEDPGGELSLSIPVTRIEAVYPDEDSDGAADGPFFGHGSLPGEDTGDGQVFSLVCGIGPTAHDSISAWDSFTCSPAEETGSDCDPIFIDLSGAHP